MATGSLRIVCDVRKIVVEAIRVVVSAPRLQTYDLAGTVEDGLERCTCVDGEWISRLKDRDITKYPTVREDPLKSVARAHTWNVIGQRQREAIRCVKDRRPI